MIYTITDLPPVWPGKRTTTKRKRAPFKTQWTRTLRLLEKELKHLGALKIEMALELRSSTRDLRQDGMLRAGARPGPAVILSFLDADSQRQAYPCDTFAWWQDNVYAIAVVLEDLRRAERYGVQSSMIRAGFKALPSQTAPTMGAAAAARIVAHFTAQPAASIVGDVSIARDAVRSAVFKTHPDRHAGSRTAYDSVDEARKVLSSHHGVSL